MLIEYGEALPEFIQSFAPAASLAYLADVARLECAWWRAYHAADAQPLEARAFAHLDPGRLEHTRFVFHPSVSLIASRHPVAAI